MTQVENKDSFFARLTPRLAPSDVLRIQGAYYMAKYGHRAQMREEIDDDGDHIRYFEHVRAVAIKLMDELCIFDPDMIITALLHDAWEDTDDLSLELIELFFGKNVARMVALLSKKPKAGYENRLMTCDDWRVLVIKLCDRAHNTDTLHSCSTEKRQRKVDETRKVYLEIFKRALQMTPSVHKRTVHDLTEQMMHKLNELQRDLDVGMDTISPPG